MFREIVTFLNKNRTKYISTLREKCVEVLLYKQVIHIGLVAVSP
jgi:hypothetical protein